MGDDIRTTAEAAEAAGTAQAAPETGGGSAGGDSDVTN